MEDSHGRNAWLAGRVGVGWRCWRVGCCGCGLWWLGVAVLGRCGKQKQKLYLCCYFFFVVLFAAAFYFCSFVGGQGHCLTRRFMKRCLAGAEDAWRISIVSSVVFGFVILFFIVLFAAAF